MFAFPKLLSPCHGSQGVLHSSPNYNFALGVNNRGPTPFRCSRFGTQQRMPLSPVRPMQGGVQNSASSVCWAKKKKTKDAKEDQKAKGFGKSTSKAQGPSVRHESKTDDDDEDDVDYYDDAALYGYDYEEEEEEDFEPYGYEEEEEEDYEMRWIPPIERLILGEQFSDWIDATLYDHMPPACDLASKESQQAWLDLAINHPITLNKGGCSVHIFGIAHGLPTNASALKALVDAVQPDTIAIEQSPRYSKRLRAVAQRLAPQLDILMALGLPAGIREAYTALSPQDRCVWRQVVYEGDLALMPGSAPELQVEKVGLMMHGAVPTIEFVAAAHLAPYRKNGISLEGIDLEEGSKAKGMMDNSAFQEEYDQQMDQIMESEDSTSFCLSSIELAFDEWLGKVDASVDGRSSVPLGYQDFLHSLDDSMDESLPLGYRDFLYNLAYVSRSPAEVQTEGRLDEKVHSRMTGTASAFAEVLGRTRNLGMVNRLQQLAEGRWSDDGPLRPRKCIVAVVGQSHVAPMRALAIARGKRRPAQ